MAITREEFHKQEAETGGILTREEYLKKQGGQKPKDSFASRITDDEAEQQAQQAEVQQPEEQSSGWMGRMFDFLKGGAANAASATVGKLYNQESVDEANARVAQDAATLEAAQKEIAALSPEEKKAFDYYVNYVSRMKQGDVADASEYMASGADDLIKKYGSKVSTWLEADNRIRNQQAADDLSRLGQQAADRITPEDMSEEERTALGRYQVIQQKLMNGEQLTESEVNDQEVNALMKKYGNRLATDGMKALGADAAAFAGNLIGSSASGVDAAAQSFARAGAALTGTEFANGFNTIDPNAGGKFNAFASSVRQERKKDIVNKYGKPAGTVYDAVSSAIDSTLRLASGNGALSLGMAGMGAFGSAVSEASERGATPLQAIMNGAIEGGTEVLTEKLPLDNLLNAIKGGKAPMRQIAVEILKNAITEPAEEEISLLVSTLSQAAILRGSSEYNQQVGELIAGGATREQAIEQASENLIDQALETAISSALSGGMSVAGGHVAGAAINSIAQNQQTQQAAQTQQQTQQAQQVQQNAVQEQPAQQTQAAQETVQNNQETVQNNQEAVQQNAPQNPAVAKAVESMQEKGKPSSNQVDAILSDPAAVEELGLDLSGTKSQQREAVREALDTMFGEAQPAEQSQAGQDMFDIMAQEAPGNPQTERTEQEKAADAASDLMIQEAQAQQTQAEQQQAQEAQEQPAQQETPVQQVNTQDTQETQQEQQTAQPEQARKEKPLSRADLKKELDKTTPVEKWTQRAKEAVEQIREARREATKAPEYNNEDRLRITKKSMKQAVDNILGSTGRSLSTEDRAAFTAMLEKAYYKLTDENATYETIMKETQKVAEWLDENADLENFQKDPYFEEVKRDIKGRKISLNEQQMQEIRSQFENVRGFRSAIKGSVVYSKNGIPLDVFWQEMNRMYPDVFRDDVTDVDMPRELVEIVSKLYREMEIPEISNITLDSIMTEIASESMDVKKAVPQMAKKDTEIGKVQREAKAARDELQAREKLLNRAIEKEGKQTDKVWESYLKEAVSEAKKQADSYFNWAMDIDDKWKKMFNDQAKRYGNDIKGLKKALADTVKANNKDAKIMERQFDRLTSEYEKVAKQLDSSKRRDILRKTNKTIKELDQMLRSGDRKLYVQDSLKTAVSEALLASDPTAVDYDADIEKLNQRFNEAVEKGNAELAKEISSRIAKKEAIRDTKAAALSSLRSAYSDIAESNRPEVRNAYSQEIMDIVNQTVAEVGDKPFSKMNSDELKLVSDMYSQVLASVKNANKELSYVKNKTIAQAAEEARNNLSDKADKKRESRMIETMLGINNKKVLYAAETIDSPIVQALTDNLMKAEDKQGKSMYEIRTAIDEVESRHDVRKLGLDKKVTVKDASGKNVDIPTAALLAIYEYSKQPSAMTHVTGEGVTIHMKGDKKSSGNTYSFDFDNIQDIVSYKLTDAQKAYADDYTRAVTGITRDKINEVSMEDRGVEAADVEDYFPIFTKGEADGTLVPPHVSSYPSFMNLGALNARRNSSNAIVIGDFRDMLAKHASQAITYNSYALPLDEFHRVMNYKGADGKTLMDDIARVYGKDTANYFKTMEQDIVKRDVSDPRAGFLGSMITNAKSAATMLNPSTVAQQPTAIARATAVIPAKFLVGKRVEVADGGRINGAYKQFQQYCGIATIKESGLFDIGLGRSVEDFLSPHEMRKGAEYVTDFFKDTDYRNEIVSSLPGLADKATWVAIWEGSKRMAASEGLSGESLLVRAGEIATEALQKTQVYDSVLSRSANMRSGDNLMKMATSFMAENTTSLNMFQSGMRDIANGDRKAGAAKIAGVAGSQLMNAAVLAVVRSAMRSFRGKDKDKTFAEKLASNFTGAVLDSANPLGYFPFLRDISSMMSGFDVERMDLSSIASAGKKLSNLMSVMGKDESEMSEEELAEYRETRNLAYADFFGSVSGLFTGINPYLITRDLYGLTKTVADAVSDGDRETTARTMWESVQDELAGIPIFGGLAKESKSEKLYEAMVSGDANLIAMQRKQYKTDKTMDAAERVALRTYDPRIAAAADALENEKRAEYERIVAEIRDEGHFSVDIIKGAVDAEVEGRKPKPSKDYTPEQVDMVGTFGNWSGYAKLPAHIQGKMRELAYTKGSLDKYETAEDFAVAAFGNELGSVMDKFRDNLKGNDTVTAKNLKNFDTLYSQIEDAGMLDNVIASAEGAEKNYLQARADGYDTMSFARAYEQYYKFSSNDDLSAKEKADSYRYEMQKYVESGEISQKEADYYKNLMVYRTPGGVANTNAFDELGRHGLDADRAAVTNQLIQDFKESYKASSGGKEAPQRELYSEIARSGNGLSESEKMAALYAVTDDYNPNASKPDVSELKIQHLAKEYGLTAKDIADAYGFYYEGKNDQSVSQDMAIKNIKNSLGVDGKTAKEIYAVYAGQRNDMLKKRYG